MPVRIDVLTLFPEFFTSPLATSLLGKALKNEGASVHCTNFRDYTTDKHRSVDDVPYGGGVGMVLKPEPLFAAVEALPNLTPRAIILLTPQGEPLKQKHLQEFSQLQQLILICGHYEGVDERVREHLVTREISLGDFVLTGGEIPALALIDGVIRLLPGTVGKAASLVEESFEGRLLEYPHYTRPPEFRGWQVPEVLRSGNHKAIAQWRQEQRQARTQERRPDLLD
ncbi:MAG: tRNA (guanosine(37)-N1)-methyltransferase TrmD [Gloeobacterales cyanobacterium]